MQAQVHIGSGRFTSWVARLVVVALTAVVALAVNLTLATVVAGPARADASTGAAGLYVPISGRLLDTRQSSALAAGSPRTVAVTGVSGIPASGVSAVAVTLTAVTPSSSGWVWAAAEGASDPGVSMLSFGPGSGVAGTVSNSALVAVSSATGKIKVQSSTSVHLVVDVQGYYTSGSSTTAGGFVPLPATRIVDTRAAGTGLPQAKLMPGSVSTLQVTGRAGVLSGASAAFVNITVLDSNAASRGYLQVYPTGGAVPATSMNYQPNAATAIGTVVPLSGSGQVNIKLSTTATYPIDVLIDVEGYYSAAAQSGAFTPAAARIYDGRTVPATVPAGGTATIPVAGVAGVPAMSTGLSAAALDVQVLAGSAGGSVEAYASDRPRPGVGTVQFQAGENRGNLAMVGLGADGAITVLNASTAPVTLIIDIQGWYVGIATSPLPVGPRLNATRVDVRVGDRVGASVDVGTGNLSVTSTELVLPGIAGDVQLGLTFNSLSLGASAPLPKGAGGYGWTSRLGQDTKLIVNTDSSIVYLAPSGIQGKYAPNGSGYLTPAGFKNTLTRTGTTGWKLTEHGSNEVSVFNSAGRLTSVVDRNAQVTTLGYNSSGQLTSLTSTRGGSNARTVTLGVDGAGLVASMTQASDTGGSRSVSYTYSGSQLRTITDAQGRVTTFGYSGGTGSGGDLTSVSNTAGHSTTFTYDPNHRVTSVSRANPGKSNVVTRFAYPSVTQTLVADPNTDQSLAVTAVPRTTYTLDATARVTRAVDPLGRTRSSSYTPFADVQSSTAAGGGVTSAEYGANAGASLTKVTSATGASMSMTYTGTGASAYLPDGVTDTQGNGSLVSYDGFGNPSGASNNATAATASVTYHSDGTLATSTDPAGKVTTYPRNAATGQTSGITPPAGSGLGATSLTYDGYARLATVTDGRGAVTSYSYDKLDRVTAITYSGFTPAAAPISYTYDSAGNLATRVDASGTTTFGYDGLARLTSRVHSAGGGTLTYGYDRNGNIDTFTNARGQSTFAYDAGNQLTVRTNPGYQRDRYAYNLDGKRTDTWWRANEARTTFAAHTHTDYDQAGRVARTWTSRASSDTTRVVDTSYCYSPYTGAACPTAAAGTDTGLIQWSVDHLTGARSSYGYDGANRLTSVSNYAGRSYAYTYDANGNRTARVVDGASTQTLTFNAGNQITSPGYGFDPAGNQSADPTVGAITYNAAGQMIAAGGAGGVQNTYAGPGQNELTRQNLPASVRMDYVYGIDSPYGVPTLDSATRNTSTTYMENDPTTGRPQALNLSSGESTFLATDGQGSVVALISANTGNPVAATYSYDPYGVVTASTGTGLAATSNLYRQASGIRDPLTGWNRHGTRYHDTTTGRWTSTDPITRLNNPDRANPYAYAASNPINYTDPTGKLDLEAYAWISTGYGVVSGAFGVYSLYALPAETGIILAAGSAFTAVFGVAFAAVGLVCLFAC